MTCMIGFLIGSAFVPNGMASHLGRWGEPVRTCTDQHGPVRISTDQYGPVRTSTDLFGSVRTCSDQYEPVRISTDQYGPARISTDQHGLVRISTPVGSHSLTPIRHEPVVCVLCHLRAEQRAVGPVRRPARHGTGIPPIDHGECQRQTRAARMPRDGQSEQVGQGQPSSTQGERTHCQRPCACHDMEAHGGQSGQLGQLTARVAPVS